MLRPRLPAAPPPAFTLTPRHAPGRGIARRASSAEAAPTSASHEIAVLGGGITGLASAYFLIRQYPRATVTVYEASARTGGWLQSQRVPVRGGSVLFEAGPRTLRSRANGVLTAKVMQELDLAQHAIFTQSSSPAARNRFVYYPDHLVRMPHPSRGLAQNVWTVLTEPVFQGGLAGVIQEPFKAPRARQVTDESIGDFFSRRFNKSLVDRVLSALIHGIYAGDVYRLSAKTLFATAWRAEAVHGSVILGMVHAARDGRVTTRREAEFLHEMEDFAWDPLLKATLHDNAVFTFTDGLGMLAERLHERLFESGRVEFLTSTAVDSIRAVDGNMGMDVTTTGSAEPRRHSHAISALSPAHLNQVAGSELVAPVPTVNVMTVNLYFRTAGLHEPGFGYLIPQATPFAQNPERALGVVFDTAYSPSPDDVNPQYWKHMSADQLQAARDRGQIVNVNDFSWYNMPQAPNLQDRVETRGSKVTVMLGGHWWDGWPDFPDEHEGLALARSVLERQLGITEEPEAWQVNFQKDCIPQYTVGHEQRLRDAHNRIWQQYRGRLRVAGNWMSGVGVNDCVRSAYDVVKHFSRDATGLEHVGEPATVRVMPVRPGGS